SPVSGSREKSAPWLTGGATLEASHNWLTRFPGWGGHGFMSYEIISDLRYTRYLDPAPDILTWANPGPGAERGIRRLLRAPSRRLRKAAQLAVLRQVFTWIDVHRDRAILDTLEMRDIEHSLCAFDKYRRHQEQLAQGRPLTRQSYRPAGEGGPQWG